MRNFACDDSAWADFLISKAALILASVILFAALFNLVASFKDLETREKLDFLAMDFKTAVDEVGSGNSESANFQEGADSDFQGESQDEFRESSYCFSEQEIFRDLPFAGDIKVRVSGEYVCLEAESGERSFRAVKPFAFRVLPLNGSTCTKNSVRNLELQATRKLLLQPIILKLWLSSRYWEPKKQS